jgi:hypothetical protein
LGREARKGLMLTLLGEIKPNAKANYDASKTKEVQRTM